MASKISRRTFLAAATAALSGCGLARPFQVVPEPTVASGQRACVNRYIAMARGLQQRNPTMYDLFDGRQVNTAGEAYALARNVIQAQTGLQGVFVNPSPQDRQIALDIANGLQIAYQRGSEGTLLDAVGYNNPNNDRATLVCR